MKKFAVEIKWSIVFVIIALLWMVAENISGLHGEFIEDHMVYTNLFMIPAVAVYVFALKDKKESYYGGYMTYKQGFISGLMIGVFVAILSPISQYITHTFIAPEYFDNVIAFVQEKYPAQAEQMIANFNMTSYMIQAAIGAVIMGAITAAIVAIFVKKNRPDNVIE
ncbi:MAG: DUF4199 domain-containing protein [Flavobacteriales bacterium]|nr:DUF4199 domain-containing protein [Flavobacteriales bacterium]